MTAIENNHVAYKSYKAVYRSDHYDWSMGHLCLRHADENPNFLAVSDGRIDMTFAELSHLAKSIAYTLQRRGIGRTKRVMVFASKSSLSVGVILGVLLSGASYVPVDENVPIERLRMFKELSGASMAITIDDLPQEKIAIFNDVLKINEYEEFDLPLELFQRLSRIAPDDEAYVLFTSGSTGTPKGVCISHRGVAAFFRNVAELMATTRSQSRYLNTSPFHYDVSLIDTFFPLSCGATVHITPGVPHPGYVLNLIERHQITHLCGVGSTLNVLVSAPEFSSRDLNSLERIMTGAEILNPKTLQAFLNASPRLGIINGYGPTEATCGCMGFLVTHHFDFSRKDIPIGKVMGDIPIKVLEDGELLIGGDQVLLGYVDGDTSRISSEDGINWFHSGDLVSLDENNDYIFRGRKDYGVKIRGHRVHLEELEATFMRFRGVESAVSAVKGSGETARTRIVLAGNLSDEQVEQFLSHCRKFLPAPMIPEKVYLKQTFPMLPSGKIDRRKLEQFLLEET